MMSGIFAAQFDISCAYPLDDNGTLAASLGFGYAGPAIGDGQQMHYTTTGAGGVKLLASSASLTSGRFQREGWPVGYEAFVTSCPTCPAGLALLITNSGGSIVNAVSLESTADSDLLQFIVSADGTISAKRNGAAFDLSAFWLNPAGQKTVGATDYFSPYLWLNDNALPGDLADIQLRTLYINMTGTYPALTADLCGNAIA